MGQSNPLDVLKQCFEKIIPSQDARTTINPMEFVVCLVFCYLGDMPIRLTQEDTMGGARRQGYTTTRRGCLSQPDRQV
jgi:hypothetical protein